MAIRRDKYDAAFSLLIRERDGYTCQACEKYGGLIDCAHIFGRRHASTRYHPDNAVALCRGCHMRFTEEPHDWADWCRVRLGHDRYDALRAVSRSTKRWRPKDKAELLKWLREQHRAIQEGREIAEWPFYEKRFR